MALSLGVSVGSRVRVGAHLVLITDIQDGKEIDLDVTSATGRGIRSFKVTENERTEILPNVFVSCGQMKVKPNSKSSRLAFEAPRSVRIDRIV